VPEPTAAISYSRHEQKARQQLLQAGLVGYTIEEVAPKLISMIILVLTIAKLDSGLPGPWNFNPNVAKQIDEHTVRE
jgi:hypothetical protein